MTIDIINQYLALQSQIQTRAEHISERYNDIHRDIRLCAIDGYGDCYFQGVDATDVIFGGMDRGGDAVSFTFPTAWLTDSDWESSARQRLMDARQADQIRQEAYAKQYQDAHRAWEIKQLRYLKAKYPDA